MNRNSAIRARGLNRLERHRSVRYDPLMEIRATFVARTYDVDFAGIVSNIVYVRWLEDLRLALLDATAPLRGLLDDGVCPVVARTEIRYRQSLRLGDEVAGILEAVAEEQGRVRSVLRFRFERPDGQVVAEACQEIVAVNLRSGRATRLPGAYLAAVGSPHRQRRGLGGDDGC